MEVTFLGTSSMVPTKKRSHNAIFITTKEDGILVDCGEGTQRQIKLAGIKPTKVSKILITHWHGDHVLGLPGLIQTMGASEYQGKLMVFGPKGTKTHFEHMRKAFIFEEKMDLEIHEVHSGVFHETKEYEFHASPMEHSVPCIAFSIIEKERRRLKKEILDKKGISSGPHLAELQEGKDIEWKGKKISAEETSYVVPQKKITVIMDTRKCDNAIELAKESDLLISEATFLDALAEKAHKYKHMTGKDAASVAKKAGVKKLILTHFSQRYKEAETVKKEAAEVFENVTAAEDFMIVNV